tara:strand:+ start:319 stop:777 length:459 start_codon:yes stop_codon:yes gene_type:complete
MNIKKNFIVFISLSILILSILNIKNPEKTKVYLFTSEIKELSLGNLITIAFFSGFTISTLLTLISKNNSNESSRDFSINDEEIDKSYKDNFSQGLEYDRPPQRDVRESQPTISVNYRFVDQDDNSYNSKNTKKTMDNINSEDNDWANKENEW